MKKVLIFAFILVVLFVSCHQQLTQADLLRMEMSKKGIVIAGPRITSDSVVFYLTLYNRDLISVVREKAVKLKDVKDVWRITADPETVFGDKQGKKSELAIEWVYEYLGFKEDSNVSSN